jgi:hypothetical protein
VLLGERGPLGGEEPVVVLDLHIEIHQAVLIFTDNGIGHFFIEHQVNSLRDGNGFF